MNKVLNLFNHFIIFFILLSCSFLVYSKPQLIIANDALNTVSDIEKKWQRYEQTTSLSVNSNTLNPIISKPAKGEGIPVGELLFFSSFLRRYYLGEVLAIKSEDGAWVDLASFFESLDFVIDIDNEELIAEGWFIKADNLFKLDVNALTVTVNNANYQLEEKHIYIDNNDIYVDFEQLKQFFSLEINLDYSALEIHLSSDVKLPIEQRLARKERNINSQGTASPPVLPWKASPYQAVSSPLADIQISALATEDDNSMSYSVLGSNDFAYLSSEYYFAGRDGDLLSDSRFSLSRESSDAELLGLLQATSVQFGDVLAVQIGNRFNSSYARGVIFDNKPLFKEVNSNQVNLTGSVQPGWDIELYRNGVLIGQQLSLSDGRYIFENIDLIFGANNFEFIFYGPQGQVERKVEEYYIDSNSLDKGESFYELSITEQGHQIFNQSRYSTGNDGWQIAGRYETGLTDYLSIYGGGSAQNNEDGSNDQNYALGSNVSIANLVLINIDYEKNNQNESEVEIAARSELAGQAIRFSMLDREQLLHRDNVNAGLTNSRSFELSLNGAIFQQDYGSLSYQNIITQTESELVGSRFSIDNTLSYSLGGTSLNNNLAWFKSEAAENDILVGNIRLQRRFGRVFSRFSIDYSVNPESDILGYQAEFNRNIGASLQGELTLRKTLVNDLNSVDLGLNWQNERFSLNSSMTYDSDDNWRLGLFSRFSLGFDSQGSDYFLSQRSLARSGTLMVQVYLDENNNGIKDDGEEGVEGIKVKGVQNHRQAVTDESGIALLTSMTANRTTDIIIDPDSFPDPFFIAANDGFSITPRAGFVEYMDIPLNNSSEVEGTIYKDSETLGFATVQLLDKQGKQVATTQAAYDGYYLFTDLRPGEYRAVIDDSFNERKSLKSTQDIVVNLSPAGDVVMGVDFVLKEKTKTTGYIANAGSFSSLTILKAYFRLIEQHLDKNAKKDIFYIKDNNRFALAVGYAQSADNQLNEICVELKAKGLNCNVQEQLIRH